MSPTTPDQSRNPAEIHFAPEFPGPLIPPDPLDPLVKFVPLVPFDPFVCGPASRLDTDHA
jgi:hypothetical protein